MFMLIDEVRYEGITILGVYSSLQRAQDASMRQERAWRGDNRSPQSLLHDEQHIVYELNLRKGRSKRAWRKGVDLTWNTVMEPTWEGNL